MWQWFRHLFSVTPSVPSPQNSAGYLARLSGLDRRGGSRIRIPTYMSTNQFPRLSHSDLPFPLMDLSVGGACVQDPNNRLGLEIGKLHNLELRVLDRQESLQCRLVGISRNINRHLQFLNLSPQALTQIALLVRYGVSGQKLRPVQSTSPHILRLQAAELWTGSHGDSLAFYEPGELHAVLSINGMSLQFFHHLPPRLQMGADPQKSRPAKIGELADVLTCLENIQQPSPRAIELKAVLTASPASVAKVGA